MTEMIGQWPEGVKLSIVRKLKDQFRGETQGSAKNANYLQDREVNRKKGLVRRSKDWNH